MVHVIAMLVAFVAVLVLGGCGGSGPGGSTSAPRSTSSAEQELPPTLFAGEPEHRAVPLAQARASAKAGDQVVFEARVGGRRDPFVDGRAIFSVADPAILSCDELHGDSCKTPWDYCCEPKDNLLANLASVQVVNGSGEPLRVSLQGVHGLAPLKTVIVAGTVKSADPANFVVNAETIHVRDAPRG